MNLTAEDDAVHLTLATDEQRVLLSGNHDDFEKLHDLVLEPSGHHPSILIVRRDNDLRHDLTSRGIVHATESSGALASS